MKYIITTGCSFTRQGKRIGIDGTEYDFMQDPHNMKKWPNYIQELYPEHKVISYGCPTNDNNLIAQSVLYGVGKLLKDGVSPSDIKVIVQWSSWTRNSVFISPEKQREKNYFLKNINNENLNPSTDLDYVAHVNDFITDKNYIGEHGYYILSGGYSYDHVLAPAIEYYDDYVDHVFSLDERLIEHFKNVLLVQNFCKYHGIDYLCFSMHNNTSLEYSSSKRGWPLWKPADSPRSESWHVVEEKYIPNTWENDHKDLFTNPYVKFLYDMVDLNHFWFYQEEGITKYGGIVEWTIKNYEHEDITTPTIYKNHNILWMENIFLVQQGNHTKENLIKYLDNSVCWQHTSAFMNKKFVQQELKHFLEK